eukprot:7111813-Pyramimonas_sp.AAC.1
MPPSASTPRLPQPWGSNVRGGFDDLERFWDHNVVDVDWSEEIGFAVPSLLPRPVQALSGALAEPIWRRGGLAQAGAGEALDLQAWPALGLH